MPTDQKRINGPEVTIPYVIHTENVKTFEDKQKQLLEKNLIRQDGRKPNEARKIFIKVGVVSQAKGSCYIELGNTKVIVSVFDPREIQKQNCYSIHGELYCDFKYSPFSCVKRKQPQTDMEEKSLALAMKRALEPVVCRHEFPNFQVDIFANVLEDGGSVLGAAITCAGLALADAGIPLYDLITATTVGIIDGNIILDPTSLEEEICLSNMEENQGIIMMARLSAHEQISELWQSGCITLDVVKQANEFLERANKDFVPVIKQILVKKILKSVKEDNDTEK